MLSHSRILLCLIVQFYILPYKFLLIRFINKEFSPISNYHCSHVHDEIDNFKGECENLGICYNQLLTAQSVGALQMNTIAIGGAIMSMPSRRFGRAALIGPLLFLCH